MAGGTETTSGGEKGSKGSVYPELIIALCAAVGTDTEAVTDALSSELRTAGYEPVLVKLSTLMSEVPGLDYLQLALPGHFEVRQQPEALLAMRASDRRNEPFEHSPDDGAPHGW